MKTASVTEREKERKTKTETEKKENKRAGEMAQRLKKNWMFFQKTWVQFSALTWQFTTVCN